MRAWWDAAAIASANLAADSRPTKDSPRHVAQVGALVAGRGSSRMSESSTEVFTSLGGRWWGWHAVDHAPD